ncbi:hypothetical protein [Streptomyces sp. NPDC058268]|uniref:hypothetical protein n=1 Tax=Streptomyces sp. NPDC058268 TaxID=3346413 RepID=UPI0036E6FA30
MKVLTQRYEKGSIIVTPHPTFSERGGRSSATKFSPPPSSTAPLLRNDLRQRPQPPDREPPSGHRASVGVLRTGGR